MDTVRLTEEEEASLAPLAKGGDRDARERLLSSVKDLAHWFAAAMKRPGVDVDDLFQEGMVGALEAIPGFDPAKGRWHSWASVWITGAMKSARGRERLVPICAGRRALVRRYRATVEEFRERGGVAPEPEAVRKCMGLSVEAYDNVVAAAEGPASRPVGAVETASTAPMREETTEADALEGEQSLAAIKTGLYRLLDPRAADVFYAIVFEGVPVWKLAARFNARHSAIRRAHARAVERLREVLTFTAA